jgi:hypothetical protein
MATRCILGALAGAVAAALLRLIGVWEGGGLSGVLIAATLIGAPLGALWGALKWNPGFIGGGAAGVLLGAVWCRYGPTVGAMVSGVVGAFIGAYLMEKHENNQRALLREERKKSENQEKSEDDFHD